MMVLCRYFNPAVKVDPEHIITGKLRNGWSSSAAADRKIYSISSHLNYSSHPFLTFEPPDRAQSAGVGVSAILDHLFHTLLDAGDGVLILNPYYAGFDRDLVGGRSGVKLVGVDWAGYEDQIQGQDGDEDEDEWAGDAGLEEAFEKALQTARADGVDVSRRSRLRRFMPITDANLTLKLSPPSLNFTLTTTSGPGDPDLQPPQSLGHHRLPVDVDWVLQICPETRSALGQR
jgi:hypothetical protein